MNRVQGTWKAKLPVAYGKPLRNLYYFGGGCTKKVCLAACAHISKRHAHFKPNQYNELKLAAHKQVINPLLKRVNLNAVVNTVNNLVDNPVDICVSHDFDNSNSTSSVAGHDINITEARDVYGTKQVKPIYNNIARVTKASTFSPKASRNTNRIRKQNIELKGGKRNHAKSNPSRKKNIFVKSIMMNTSQSHTNKVKYVCCC